MSLNSDYKLLFFASLAYWEESFWIAIWEKDGQYFTQDGGHCVMCKDDIEEFCPEPISEQEAFDLMVEHEEYEDTNTNVEELFRDSRLL
jgi:hypothetical protein